MIHTGLNVIIFDFSLISCSQGVILKNVVEQKMILVKFETKKVSYGYLTRHFWTNFALFFPCSEILKTCNYSSFWSLYPPAPPKLNSTTWKLDQVLMYTLVIKHIKKIREFLDHFCTFEFFVHFQHVAYGNMSFHLLGSLTPFSFLPIWSLLYRGGSHMSSVKSTGFHFKFTPLGNH